MAQSSVAGYEGRLFCESRLLALMDLTKALTVERIRMPTALNDEILYPALVCITVPVLDYAELCHFVI
jgi:hypothetical protein